MYKFFHKYNEIIENYPYLNYDLLTFYRKILVNIEYNLKKELDYLKRRDLFIITKNYYYYLNMDNTYNTFDDEIIKQIQVEFEYNENNNNIMYID